MKVSFKFGIDNAVTRQLSPGATMGEALSDANLRAILGYGTNVAGHVQGEPQPDTLPLRDGMVVVIHDKACTKGS